MTQQFKVNDVVVVTKKQKRTAIGRLGPTPGAVLLVTKVSSQKREGQLVFADYITDSAGCGGAFYDDEIRLATHAELIKAVKDILTQYSLLEKEQWVTVKSKKRV